MQRKLATYENGLLLTLSIAEGCLLLDRVAIGLMTPFITQDLVITNTQLGLLSAAFTTAFALAGYLFSAASDASNRRNAFLLTCVICFSLTSSMIGLATSFAAIVVVRILLGIAEGPFLPIALAKMAAMSTPSRVSFNLGFVQQVGAFVIAQGIGPVLLTWLGQTYGWRTAFIVTGAPGLFVCMVLWLLLRKEGPQQAELRHSARREPVSPPPSFSALLKYRNAVLCCLIASSMGTWILLQITFLPQYLVKVAHLTPTTMGFVMSMVGISGCAASLIMPLLSDRYGRRPVLAAGALAGLILPLSVLLLPPQPIVLVAAVLIGAVAFGCSPMYVAIIPTDTVPKALAARAIALVSACSALVGGVLMPLVAGRLADAYGVRIPLWMAAGGAILACGVALCLTESAPRLVAQRRGANLAATDSSTIA